MRWRRQVQGHANAGTTWRISNPANCYENAISQMDALAKFTNSQKLQEGLAKMNTRTRIKTTQMRQSPKRSGP